MTQHRILAKHSQVTLADRLSISMIRRCIRHTLKIEGVDMSCEVSVLVTNDIAIRRLNNEFRKIDKATDVLSFPMQEFSPPGWDSAQVDEIDPKTGLVPLGDITFSAQRVKKQAHE